MALVLPSDHDSNSPANHDSFSAAGRFPRIGEMPTRQISNLARSILGLGAEEKIKMTDAEKMKFAMAIMHREISYEEARTRLGEEGPHNKLLHNLIKYEESGLKYQGKRNLLQAYKGKNPERFCRALDTLFTM